MRKFLSYFFLILALASCSSRNKVIPKDTLTQIYAEMFLVDEWLTRHPQGFAADTTLVFEPVFEKYGYTSDDYRESVSYYLEDPDRFSRILKRSVKLLESEQKKLEAEKKALAAVNAALERTMSFAPERIFNMTSLFNKQTFSIRDSIHIYVDSTGGEWMFDPQKGADTIFCGPNIIIDTLQIAPADTLDVTPPAIDSLTVDTLSVARPKLMKFDKVKDVEI